MNNLHCHRLSVPICISVFYVRFLGTDYRLPILSIHIPRTPTRICMWRDLHRVWISNDRRLCRALSESLRYFLHCFSSLHHRTDSDDRFKVGQSFPNDLSCTFLSQHTSFGPLLLYYNISASPHSWPNIPEICTPAPTFLSPQ